jgi:hypothetical protein
MNSPLTSKRYRMTIWFDSNDFEDNCDEPEIVRLENELSKQMELSLHWRGLNASNIEANLVEDKKIK